MRFEDVQYGSCRTNGVNRYYAPGKRTLHERIAEPVKCLHLKRFASGKARGKVESDFADIALLGSNFAKQIDFGRTAAAVGEPPGMEANARDNVWVTAGPLFCCREVARVDPAIKDPQSYSRSFVGNSIRVSHQIKMAVCIK